ncbi:MAG: hypothetical protein IT355_06375 [Gemmatimonadaceae bacterium]|nr:hypothetical protein [Gemmatimonadaceae bacterium]
MTAAGGIGQSLDPTFLTALASVPPEAWTAWFADRVALGSDGTPLHRTLQAAFALPGGAGHAALCVFEAPVSFTGGDGTLAQAALRRWPGPAPEGARVLHEERDAAGSVLWTLASAWADPDLRTWLREALSAGAVLRADGWEWVATPERSAVSRSVTQASRQLAGRRHDVVLFEPAGVAILYRRLTRGGQAELDLLRHLERVPVAQVAPALLGSAILRSPSGQRSASAALETLADGTATVRSVVVGRLRRALDGDPSLQASALDDVRAVGVATRELHAGLGRPFAEGVLVGAEPAGAADVDAWVARTWTALDQATTLCADGAVDSKDRLLQAALPLLPARLQQFAAAAESAPGIIQRIHGSLTLDAVLITPPRHLTVVEFDGDPGLPDEERLAPQSPWRDVARVLVSIAESAAEAARLAGGDDKALEIAWLWEREARKAYLEGYGSGGGALHALLAIFEMEFAARLLRDAADGDVDGPRVASHTLQRLSRTIA